MNSMEVLALGLGAAFVIVMVAVIAAMYNNPEDLDD